MNAERKAFCLSFSIHRSSFILSSISFRVFAQPLVKFLFGRGAP